MPGFGVVRFDKTKRKITMECWPRMTDPTNPQSRQYEGWPRTIRQIDNYGRQATAWLPEIQVRGINNPVVRIIDEKSGELLYTIRVSGTSFRPKVFRKGLYTIQIGETESNLQKEKNHIPAVTKQNRKVLEFNL